MSRTAGQDIGQALEDAVQAGCDQYLLEGVAKIDKIPTPIKQLKRGDKVGVFVAVHLKEAWTDFYGVFLRGPKAGQAIAIECKATTADRLFYSAVEPQQRDWLDATPNAFVLVEFVSLRAVRLVPWSQMQPGTSVKVTDGWNVAAVRFLAPLLTSKEAP